MQTAFKMRAAVSIEQRSLKVQIDLLDFYQKLNKGCYYLNSVSQSVDKMIYTLLFSAFLFVA